MARALLDTSHGVLIHYGGDLELYLKAMPPVRDALVALGFDLAGAEAELHAAVDEGTKHLARVGSKEIDEQWERKARKEIVAKGKAWVKRLRTRLKLVGPGGAAAVAEVREQLHEHQRNYARVVKDLRCVMPVLRAQHAVLAPEWGRPDPLEEGEALLVEAELLDPRLTAVKKELRARRAIAKASRSRILQVIRSIRHHWTAVLEEPGVPPMPMTTLLDARDGKDGS